MSSPYLPLVAADYDKEIARYQKAAAAESVYLGKTRDTYWFRTQGREGFGAFICLPKGKARIKGIFVHPEWRGLGVGTVLTEGLIAAAIEHGRRGLEVLTGNPDFYRLRGFSVVRRVRHDTWLLVKGDA